MIWPHSPLPESITHPGVAAPQAAPAPTYLVDLDVELPADVSLHDSLANMVTDRNLKGAFVRVQDAPMSAMKYVIPGLAPDASHVAWYSKTYTPTMPGQITDAGITCGHYGGKPFYHCHGMMQDADGNALMGHLFPETCVPSQPVRVRGVGFTNATFSRVQDVETGFELFKTEQSSPAEGANGLLLRIGPNAQLDRTLIETCQAAGWDQAEVHGVGSIIGAHFDDGRVMQSFATELMITEGRIDLTDAPRAGLDIALVGLDGKFMQGRLIPGRNPVLITAEIVLKRL